MPPAGARKDIAAYLTGARIPVVGIEVGHDVVLIDIRGVPVIAHAQVEGEPRVYAEIILRVIGGLQLETSIAGRGQGIAAL